MQLYLHNIPLKRNIWFDAKEIGNIEFYWNPESNVYYTLAIYDIDAPRPNQNSSSPYMHLLITNIPTGADEDHYLIPMISKGDFNFPYMDPKPPLDSENHRYLIVLFEQEGQIIGLGLNRRSRFPLETFKKENGLHIIDKEVIEINPQTYQFFLRDKETDPLDPIHPLIMPGANLTDKEKDYCSCVLKAANKQTTSCLTDKAWFGYREGKECYNPYAICSKSVGTTSRKCGENYNYEEMTNEQLIHYLALHGISVSPSSSRESLLATIRSKKF